MLDPIRKPKPVKGLEIPLLLDDPDYQKAVAELDALRVRAEETERRRQAAIARKRGESTKRPLLARAADLLAGGFVPALGNPIDELRACDEEDSVIYPVMAETRARADAIADQVAFKANTSLQPAHRDALRSVNSAITALHQAIAAALDVQRRLAEAGLKWRSDLLPLPIPEAAFRLGDPAQWNSQAAAFKRKLEKLKVL